MKKAICKCGEKAFFQGLCKECYVKAHPESRSTISAPPSRAKTANLLINVARASQKAPMVQRQAIGGNFYTLGEVGITVGAAFAGKTWLQLHVCNCVATGAKLWDRYTPTVKAPAIYLLGDQDISLIKGRARALGYDSKDLYLVSKRDLIRARGSWDISDPEALKIVREAMQDLGAKFLVLDSYFSLTQKSEIKGEEVKPVLEGLQRLAQATGAHVNLVHHTKKRDRRYVDEQIEGDDTSGSSIFQRASGELYTVQKDRQYPEDTVGWLRQKGGWYKVPRPFRYEVLDEGERVILAFDHEADPRKGGVYRILEDIKRQRGPFTLAHLGYNGTELRKAQRAMALALEEGAVKKTGSGRATMYEVIR